MTQRHVLDARSFPLHGSRLIEASAGTGKTWTIAALYVRLVLGHGGEHAFGKPLMPADILVMTFTRAATRELSDRIRARLVQAAAYFRGQVPEQETPDPFLLDLMAAYPEGPQRERAAWQLAMAAESMDDAAIFTIDAWCQRMLREHAFDSGNLFDETLESDESQRLVEAAQDYWRQQCYPLQGQELAMVLQVWKSFADCYEALRSHRPEDMASFVPDGQSLQQLVQQAQAAQQALVQPWKTIFPRFRDWRLQQV
ncbi:MAG: UvrD-helicase domain-containing protein, partial [Comamonadaceae bacterium]|nr:UvrD-helicase domain-containing protein [Comamonadaceae bacterium]